MCQQDHQGHQSQQDHQGHQGHQNDQEGHKVSRCSPKSQSRLMSLRLTAVLVALSGPLFSHPFSHLMIE